MKSLSESSQVSSSLAFMDVIVILLTVSRDHKKGKLQSGPPCEGGPERAMGKQEGQGAASKHALVDNIQRGEHAPSVIGGLQPSLVRFQSATYQMVSANLATCRKSV